MIRSDQRGQLQVLTIDRHEQRNALNVEHLQGLLDGLDDAERLGSRCVVITGAGSSFCSGADLDTVTDDGFRVLLQTLLHRLSDLPVPVIAAVNGPAIGAGTKLAISCDLRVAAPTARFSVPTAKLGLAIATWSVRRLTTLVGGGGARALLLGVESVDAPRAHTMGLVDRLGSVDDALDWAQEIADLAPLTLRYCKLAIAAAEYQAPDPEAQAKAEAALAACWASDDVKEALQARQERRPPVFQGR
jgi:enoyl-CoA hydratase